LCPPYSYRLENTTVCRDRQTAFLPRFKPGVSCLILMKRAQVTSVMSETEEPTGVGEHLRWYAGYVLLWLPAPVLSPNSDRLPSLRGDKI
jgi:hypothetical protein